MSQYMPKRRRGASQKSKQKKGYKMAAATRAYKIPKIGTNSPCHVIGEVWLADVGGTVYKKREVVAGSKKIGHITIDGKVYNVVITPEPNPDTSIDDDTTVKRKNNESEA